MKFVQKRSSGGVIYNYGYADHFKTAYLSVDLIMPLTAENATAMSLLAGVMSRGCAALPRMDLISRYLSRYYGASLSITADKAGELELLTFACSFLNREYAANGEDIAAAVLKLLDQILFEPLVVNGGFDKDYVNQEKANLDDRIIGLINDKRLYALERCKQIMCEGEPYAVMAVGSSTLLHAMSAADLYAFYKRMMREAVVVINYVGREDGAVGALSHRFADRPAFSFKAPVQPVPERPREVTENMEISQSKLTMGFRLGESARKNGSASRLFNVLYGNGPTSKLFLNVREKRSLCYYCSSAMDRLKNVMLVNCGIDENQYEAARNEVEAQLLAMAQGDFSDEELERAKLYMIDAIRSATDSESALSSMMLTDTLNGALKTPEETIAEISAVTREELICIAAEIRPDTVYLLKGAPEEA